MGQSLAMSPATAGQSQETNRSWPRHADLKVQRMAVFRWPTPKADKCVCHGHRGVAGTDRGSPLKKRGIAVLIDRLTLVHGDERRGLEDSPAVEWTPGLVLVSTS